LWSAIFTRKTFSASANIDIAVTRNLKTGLITNGRVVVTIYAAVEGVPAEACFSVSYCVFWLEFLLMLDC
jgi:hypothetical protein